MGVLREAAPLFGSVLVVCALRAVWIEGELRGASFALIIVGIYLLIRRSIWIYRSVRSSLAGKGSQDRTVVATPKEESFEIETTTGQGISKWSAFVDLHSAEQGLLLYPSKGIYYWIPKDAEIEDGDWNQLKSLLEEKIRRKI